MQLHKSNLSTSLVMNSPTHTEWIALLNNTLGLIKKQIMIITLDTFVLDLAYLETNVALHFLKHE